MTSKISGIISKGIFVQLDKTGTDGFIPLRDLNDDYYSYDEKTQSVIGKRKKISWHLGQLINVKIIELSDITGSVRLKLLS